MQIGGAFGGKRRQSEVILTIKVNKRGADDGEHHADRARTQRYVKIGALAVGAER